MPNNQFIPTVTLNANNIEEAKKLMHKRILVALEACGLYAERMAKEKCPVDTGRLRNSITHVVSGDPERSYSFNADFTSRYLTGSNRKLSKEEKAMDKKTYIIPKTDENLETLWIGTNVFYGKYVETGVLENGGFRKPKPFLAPALADHTNEYRAIITKYLKKGQNT